MKTFATAAAMSGLAAVVAGEVTGKLGDAAAIRNNPLGASYYAYLPNSETTPIRGSIMATSNAGGYGVRFSVSMANLPADKAPFTYHIHAMPVDVAGNCESTLAHLDPYIRGEDPPCDPSKPETCQVGDLAGKHGAIDGTSYVTTYTDMYASTLQGIGAYFGNRSVVVHDKDGNRLTCANFQMNSPGYTYPNTTSPYPCHNTTTPPSYTSTPGVPVPPTNTPPAPPSAPTNTPPTGAAATLGYSVAAVLAAAMAMLL